MVAGTFCCHAASNSCVKSVYLLSGCAVGPHLPAAEVIYSGRCKHQVAALSQVTSDNFFSDDACVSYYSTADLNIVIFVLK